MYSKMSTGGNTIIDVICLHILHRKKLNHTPRPKIQYPKIVSVHRLAGDNNRIINSFSG